MGVGLVARAVEQGDEADEAFGGMVARMDMPPHARAVSVGRGHRFAADMARSVSSPRARCSSVDVCSLGEPPTGHRDGGRGRALRRRVTLIYAGYAGKPEQSRMTVFRRE